MPTIDAIAFDWGGVFTEGTFDSSAVRNLAALFGVSEAEVGEHYYPLMSEFERGAFDLHAFYQKFCERSGLHAPEERFRESFLGAVHERPGMFELVQRIPERYRVGMLSNNVPVLCDLVRNDPRLKRIEHFVFSNEIGVRKPDARAFGKLNEALGAPPEATVFVDDNPDNIAAARALGYHALLLDNVAAFKEAWQTLLPDIPAGDLRD
jgi:putative hydrolase of the HAD superfamily